MKLSKQDMRLGAIWRVTVRNRLAASAVAELMTRRLRMQPASAAQLVRHWAGTEVMKRAGACKAA